MKKANLLKLALLSVFCLALATVNGQNKLSDEAVKVIKELKQVDTKGLSADEAQTVMKVLNLIKRENSPTPEFHQRDKVQAAGFTTVRKGDVTTEPIANVDLAVKAVNQGNVLVILDGIEISEEKFKSLDPNSIEKLELRKGETMKVLYGEKAANGVLFITSVKAAAENEQRAARRANAQNVHVVTKADLKPVDSATKEKVISIFEPTFHVRGSMAGIENINSDELPVISKFKQNGNQVSFRIEVPKTENAKKQKININYTLPNM